MNRKLTLAVVVIGAVCALGSPKATAQNSSGFDTAVESWLQGQEEPAIRALADLASKGDTKAQILLALIDTTLAYQGPWVRSLPRSERLKLLRAEGGISGQSWMKIAAQSSDLAQHWLNMWDGDAKAEVILDFARQGELRAAHLAARTLHAREKHGIGALADDPAFPEILLPAAILDWQRDDPVKAKAATQQLTSGAPGQRVLGLGDPAAAELYAWAKEAPQGRALLATLAALCPASQAPAEDLAAFFAQSGGYWGLAWIGPPSETLIDPMRYATSPKAAEIAANLLRSAPLAAPDIMAASPCIAEVMAQKISTP